MKANELDWSESSMENDSQCEDNIVDHRNYRQRNGSFDENDGHENEEIVKDEAEENGGNMEHVANLSCNNSNKSSRSSPDDDYRYDESDGHVDYLGKFDRLDYNEDFDSDEDQ